MAKPVYYVWKTHDMTEEEYESRKQYYKDLGYLVVGLIDGKGDIHEALKGIIKDHMIDHTDQQTPINTEP